GWIRYTFDQLGIPYTSIDKSDLRRGQLRSRFDAVIVPNGPGSLAGMIHEHDRALGVMPFTRTDQFPSHGTPLSTPDMTGGMGFEGLGELRRFVEEGGLLLTLREASRLAGESGFVREMSSLALGQLFHPGSVVRVKARRSNHPVLNGYPETFHIFRGNGSLFSLARRDRGMMVLQYGTKPAKDEEEPKDSGPMLGIPDTTRADSVAARTASGTGEKSGDPYVLSGMVRNDDVIIGQAAIIDAPLGRGHVIAYTFNPLHRFLNQQDFGLVWNALLNWNDLPGKPAAAPPEAPPGWSAR
ncbi:MAG: peptidase, partial [Gemmatimonadota bacterium]|nr:peptidase [Gemmatimonadota bacterium]